MQLTAILFDQTTSSQVTLIYQKVLEKYIYQHKLELFPPPDLEYKKTIDNRNGISYGIVHHVSTCI